MKVGPPPIAPMANRNPQLGTACLPSAVTSPASGATMPNPSVALWSAKPITNNVARAISLFPAACPIARPSAKLWSPIPTAISSASWRAGDQVASPWRGGASVSVLDEDDDDDDDADDGADSSASSNDASGSRAIRAMQCS